uniref:BCatenin1 n=1 Tax=Bdelloura candida TaxID=46766 RepID=A0AA51NHM8_BDECA|nr:putative bCatenin1 [Bdelloura candida]
MTMNDNCKMINSPQSDDFVNEKVNYTRSWQQNQYLVDSGINSALETHAPSVSSKHGYDDMDSDYGIKTKSESQISNKINGNNVSNANDAFSNDMCLLTPDTPNSTQYYKSQGGEAMADASGALSVTDSVKREEISKLADVDINIDKLEVESAMPDLVKLIKDEDDAVILNEATMMIFQLSKSDAIDALINSDEMISCIIEAIDKAEHAEAVRFLAGVIYNMSQKKHGLKVIFEKNVIPCLVKLLGFSMESVLFYAITTLHNLLLYQEGGKEAVRLSGCIPKMVALLQKNNIKFLTICTDCLQILAFNHQPSKIEILKHGGPVHLIHIIKTYDYEKLLWTATRVIKVLSVCSANKPVIIREGGIDALTNILYHTIQKSSSLTSYPPPPASTTGNATATPASTTGTNADNTASTNPDSHHTETSSTSSTSAAPQFSQRLLHNCLWTLRNLSDAATRLNFDNLLKVLTEILINASNSFHRQNYQIDTNAVTCAAGILSNLTCNNQFNKMTLFKIGGVEAILRTIEWNLVIITSNNPTIKISNTYYPEELLEPCICALRHISSRHEQAEAAQSAIIQYQGLCVLIKLLEIQLGPDLYHMQTHQSILPNLFLSYYNINWNLIKAIIGLIRNLAMSPCNFLPIREKGFVWPMIVLINRAQIDIFNKAASGSISQNCKLLEEIIEVACGALHMLAKDPGIRAQILSIKLWQRLINSPQQIGVQPAVYVIANLILNLSESVQRVAVGLLVEVSAEKYGLELIMNQPFITSRLNEMVHSNNEAISTYASAILIRVSEEKNKRYNGSQNYLSSPSSGVSRPISVNPLSGSNSSGYLSSMLTSPTMQCGQLGASNSNIVHRHSSNMSSAEQNLMTNDLMMQMNDMDVSDFPAPPYSGSSGGGGGGGSSNRYCSPSAGIYMDSSMPPADMMSPDYGRQMKQHPGTCTPGGTQSSEMQHSKHPHQHPSSNSQISSYSNYKPRVPPPPSVLNPTSHSHSHSVGTADGSTAEMLQKSKESASMDVCMPYSTDWLDSCSPEFPPSQKCWSPTMDK